MNGWYKCTICFCFYTSKKDLNNHVVSIHVPEKTRLLPIDEKRKHQRKELSKVPNLAPKCVKNNDFEGKDRDKFEAHLKAVRRDQNLRKQDVFLNEIDLGSHNLLVHNKNEPKNNHVHEIDLRSVQDQKGLFHCEKCGLDFESVEGLKEHITLFHEGNVSQV